MRLRDIQLILWPRGYRGMIRKAAEAEGLSVNAWLVNKVSPNLEFPARGEMVGNTTGSPPVTITYSSEDRHETRPSGLARVFKKSKNWIGEKRSVFREPADQYLEYPQPVQVTIPLQGGKTRRLNAIAKFQDESKRTVMAEFPEENLPPDKEINTSKQGLVTFKLNGPPVFMPVSIESVPDRKRLFLKDKGFVFVSSEKRTVVRINASFTLGYKRQTHHGFRQAQGIDINTKGVQFQCRESLKEGEILGLNIKLPRAEPYLVICTGRVVWSKEVSDSTRATGCQFLNPTEQDRDAIADFCLREILRREENQ